MEGEVLEALLDQADPIDLEHEFHWLSKKTLGSKRGSYLFRGHTWYFYDFSPTQRTWIWYLIFLISGERNRRDRRNLARFRDTILKNQAAEARDPATDG